MSARPSTHPLVALCGLHGGAGTTRLAVLLAGAAARRTPGAPVLLTETDPAGGGLTHATDARTPQGISDLARIVDLDGELPSGAGPGGARVIAAAPGARSPAAVYDVKTLLERVRPAHQLTVVDAGTLREPHGQGALLAATHVIWVIATGADTDHARTLLASPLSHAAAASRQAMLVNRARPDAPSRLRHRQLATTTGKLILVPLLTDPDTETYVAQCLLAAIT